MNGLILSLSIMTIIAAGIQTPFFTEAYAQVPTITVNQTEPCFLNYTASFNMWENCGMEEDFLEAAFSPWEYVTGGNFSALLVSIFILFTYIKYHKAVYPLLIGVVFLPVSFFVFPTTFLTWALVMAGLAITALIWFVFIKQTKEY